MKEIKIGNKQIGNGHLIFLIAEAGVNHNGKLAVAKKLIDLAVEANVDAIKFQTFVTEELFLPSTPKVKYQKLLTDDDENFYEMAKKYEFSKEEFKILKDYCDKNNLLFLSTPFDFTSVDWLEEFNVPCYKVSSGDMNNMPFLKYICSKDKPIFLSTGMANINEVIESINFIKSNNIEDIVVFQCTTSYPTPYEDINLNVIETYKKEFPNVLIGFSDHSLGIEASVGAAAKGVNVIEKHFTLDKRMEGPDHEASLNPEELVKWVESIRNLEKALGTDIKKPTAEELEIAKVARKSVVSIKDIKKGEIIEQVDLGIKRPGYGIEPKDLEKVLGKKAKKNIPKDSIINIEDIE